MRTNRKLLQLLLFYTNLFMADLYVPGLCSVIRILKNKNLINTEEWIRLNALIKLFDHFLYEKNDRFWWCPYDMEPRINWLTKILKKHYEV